VTIPSVGPDAGAFESRRQERRRRLQRRQTLLSGSPAPPPTLWRGVFGNDRPVEIEIGPGTGTFILAATCEQPQVNFFAIERSHSRVRELAQLLSVHPRPNLRVLDADAACVVRTLVPQETVSAYHIYFPDPWWKRRHFRRRLFTPAFASALARTLVPGGHVHTATDVDDVFELVCRTFESSGNFACDPRVLPNRRDTTSFERKGLLRGATIRRRTFVKRAA
jgi:tRNA (guanine-N7-)-methyltransferase